mgnify:CR=1 FL=1
MRAYKLIALLLTVMLAAIGCDRHSEKDETDSPQETTTQTSEPSPDEATDEDTEKDLMSAQDADAKRGAAAVNRFTHAMLPKIEEGNASLSPISVSTAMAMAYAGSGGETARQLAAAMHYGEATPADLGALGAEIATRNKEVDGETTVELSLVNDLWMQEGFPIEQAYIDFMKSGFQAEPRQLDFAKSPGDAREEINAYVSEQTREKIPKLIPDSVIDGDTRTVLTNAMYLKAPWRARFEERLTEDGTFHAPGGDVEVPMMRNEEYYGTYSGSNYDALELPYMGQELAALVVLPKKGKLGEVEESMTAAEFAEATGGLQRGYVKLTLPRFKVRKSLLLVESFRAMGANAPFQKGADFDAINPKLFIGEVVHEAYVDVNEKGTEAAAATAVVMQAESMPPKATTFTVDRPFLFYIYDKPTGSILFVTRVVNPAQ